MVWSRCCEHWMFWFAFEIDTEWWNILFWPWIILELHQLLKQCHVTLDQLEHGADWSTDRFANDCWGMNPEQLPFSCTRSHVRCHEGWSIHNFIAGWLAISRQFHEGLRLTATKTDRPSPQVTKGTRCCGNWQWEEWCHEKQPLWCQWTQWFFVIVKFCECEKCSSWSFAQRNRIDWQVRNSQLLDVRAGADVLHSIMCQKSSVTLTHTHQLPLKWPRLRRNQILSSDRWILHASKF